jgi:putative transcriptional regulator
MTKPKETAGKTDWPRIAAMSDEERMAGALSDPDAQPLTDAQLAKARRANAVKTIRAQLHMTQAEFSSIYRLPLSTLRDWEQARTHPDAPARALLTAIAADPATMRRLINGERSAAA